MTPNFTFGWLMIALLWCATPHAQITLTDDTGATLVLEKPARRIVSLAPHITESLFAVGAGEKIIATVSYSDYPAAAETIPRIGAYDRINRESLIALEPDLVVAWVSGNGLAVIEHLRKLGLPVYATEPRRLDDIPDTLRALARLAGTDKNGNRAATDFETRLSALRRNDARENPVTVFYQVWNKPLLTLNGDHLISDVIALCGGTNIFGNAAPLVPSVNVESVLRANPGVIIASGMGEERPEWVDAWRRWPSLAAVRDDQLYFIPPSLLQRHSTRILDGAERMCRYLDRARHTDATGRSNEHDD